MIPDALQERLVAAVDLVGRTGATGFELGYLHDDVPIDRAAWWAHAQYRGTRIAVEDQLGPVDAAEALARRLLDGGKCAHCGSLVTLDPAGAYATDRTMLDGTPWLAEQQADAGLCLWHREGQRWVRGCESASAAVRKPSPRSVTRGRPKRRRR